MTHTRAARRVTVLATLLAALTTLLAGPGRASAASLQEVTGFGTNPGNLQMFRYVPDGLPAGRPVVVALHGCTQNATAYAAGTGWTELADRWRFSVVFPQQRTANNANSCFNWFEPGDTRRGAGEALSIKQMVDRTRQDLGAGTAWASGLSAGGAMTAVLLAAYPDVFSGGGVVAGLPYGCAGSVVQAFGCMSPGVNLTPAQWGDKVRAAHTGGPRPKVSIWHGTADTTVVPANAGELVEQWTDVHGTDQTPDVSDTVAGHPHRVYGGVVELYQVTGMGHGQPVHPGTGPDRCGTAGAYVLDVDICAAYHMGRFWGLDTGSPTPTTSATTTTRPAYTETATDTATGHYLAGRVGVTDYTTLGARHGYTTPFPLYRCAAGWTDRSDCSPI